MSSLKSLGRRSKEGLMLVDNPKLFFSSLCPLEGRSFNADVYRQSLASHTKKGVVHEKTRDTYFYMANILNLIHRCITGVPIS